VQAPDAVTFKASRNTFVGGLMFKFAVLLICSEFVEIQVDVLEESIFAGAVNASFILYHLCTYLVMRVVGRLRKYVSSVLQVPDMLCML